ncbi:MAG TPA: hypothetical protein VFN11_05425 [Ktedonobacterales bacterium]|nr:hypothetical protein [Ktedonobacterales bacterium]
MAGYTLGILENMLKGATPLQPEDIARAVVFAIEQPAHYAISESTKLLRLAASFRPEHEDLSGLGRT